MKNIKKIIPLACAISSPFFLTADDQNDTKTLLASAPMFAAKTNGNGSTNGNNTPKKTASERDVSERMITPAAGPSRADVVLSADFIWWKAQQDGLTYAFNGTTGGDQTLNAHKGHMHQPHFKYEPGLKVALGVLGNHDNWSFITEYTWLKVDKSSTTNNSEDKGLNNALVGSDTFETEFNTNPVASTSQGSWGLHFNVLDAALGRNFWVSKRLAVKPHVGLKFSWIKQEFDSSLTDPAAYSIDLFDEISFQQYASSVEYKQKIRQFGIGLRAGLDNSFHMSRNWAIFGDFAVTGMWNRFKSTRKDYVEAPLLDITANTQPADIHYKHYPVTAVLEIDLGLRFQTIFNKDKCMFLIQAGWETQVWFDQGQFVNVNALSAPGNLSMQGLTVKTGFYF